MYITRGFDRIYDYDFSYVLFLYVLFLYVLFLFLYVLFLYVIFLYVLFLYILFLYVLSFYNAGKRNVPSYRSDTCNPGLLWPTWVCLRDC
ncbi:hypothetical protein ABVK25_008666 [Lepraria finkii]|uniref:NADH dehydrogenase subunit 1 n=1 Tax=Lepraria finkii TaxID=1340010 RepID=A0ABR4AZJ1_9LECA